MISKRLVARAAIVCVLPTFLVNLPVRPAAAAFTHVINQVQGSGSSSSLVGQVVMVEGIVTARRSNAFFLQAADAEVDANPASSEGILIFTSSAPPAGAAIGNRVQVTGTVTEFIPTTDPSSPSLTELTSPSVLVLSTGNPLPAPIAITLADAAPGVPREQLERLEGMRVSVASLTVVAPTQGAINEVSATATSNGVFFGVLSGVARPFRESGIVLPDPLPSGSPCCVPRFDSNPERIRVDSDGQTGVSPVEVSTGAIVTGLTGVLDYASRCYTLVPDGAPASVTPGVAAVSAVRAPGADEFTLAVLNTQRLFDTINDPAVSDPVLTTTAYQLRLGKLSPAIRDAMRTPDILGVASVENLGALQDLANRLNADAVAAGQPNPNYAAFLVEGNDVNGIDVGFLVRGSRVSVVDVTQVGAAELYVNPDNGVPTILFDRPPLVLRANVQPAVGPPLAVTVVMVHLQSMNLIGSATDGNRIRTRRRAQAEYLANYVQARQLGNPTERIAVIGDFNAFPFNDGYVDMTGTMRGVPTSASQVVLPSADLVTSDLVNAVDGVADTKRYSWMSDGSAVALEQVLLNTNLLPFARGLEFARIGADFPETFRNLSGRAERITDQDPAVAFFSVSATSSVPTGPGAGPGLAAPLAWPNPTRGACRLSFTLAAAGEVILDVYDLSGRPVARVASGQFETGTHSITWDGRDRSGARVSAGHYFLRLESGGQVAAGRLVVITHDSGSAMGR